MPVKTKNLLALTFLSLFVFLVFYQTFVFRLLPIPYNIMVGWYFPFNLGGWEAFQPGIIFKGGLFAADVFRQMIPWKSLSLEILQSGHLPLWNPYNFSGEPLLANPQVLFFHPISLLFLLLDFNLAWSLFIILTPSLGAFFMYFFTRSLKLSPPASTLAALAFAFSGHMISWLEWGVVTNSAIWLPLLLYSLNRQTKNQDATSKLLFVFSLYSTILGGYPQESLYSLLIAAAYFLYRSIPQKQLLSCLKTVFPLTVATFFLALPQLIPTFKLFLHSALNSAVSQDLFLKTRLHPFHLLTLFSPDYFGNRITNNYWADTFTSVDYTDANLFIGTPALIFALISFFHRNKPTTQKLFQALFALSLLISVKNPASYLLGKLSLPIISTGVAAGGLFIGIFSMSILAAFGFDYTKKHFPQTSITVPTIAYSALAVSLLSVPTEFRTVALRNSAVVLSIAAALVLILALNQKQVIKKLASTLKLPPKKLTTNLSQALIIATFFLAGAEYFRYSQKILSFSPRQYAYPQHPLLSQAKKLSGYNRVIGFWNAELATNLHTQYRLFSPEGYNPLHSRIYQELTSSADSGQLPPTLKRSDADFSQNNLETRNRLLDLTSVKYILARVTNPQNTWEEEPLKYPPDRFQLVWQKGLFKLYQNKLALPRVKLYANYLVIPDKNQRLKHLFSSSWDPHSSLILNQPPGEDIHPQATGSAKIISYQPNQVNIQTNTSGGNLVLLLTDSFYPSWSAAIDQQPTQILPANHAFRAVIVPPGTHTINFTIHWP